MATDIIPEEYFLVNVSGQIETADFQGFDYIWLKYGFAFGKDWSITSGVEQGITQTSMKSSDDRALHSFNFPLEVCFKSTNAFGWPQLVLSAYGAEIFGNDVARGYGACHVPLQPGRHSRKIGMFTPESSSKAGQFFSWLMGKRPEFCNPNTIASDQGRAETRMRSQGSVKVTFNVSVKNMNRCGYITTTSKEKIGLRPVMDPDNMCHPNMH